MRMSTMIQSNNNNNNKMIGLLLLLLVSYSQVTNAETIQMGNTTICISPNNTFTAKVDLFAGELGMFCVLSFV